MSSTSKQFFTLLTAAIIIITLARVMKNFGLLMFGSAIGIVSFIVKVKKYFNIGIPIISILTVLAAFEFGVEVEPKTLFEGGTGYSEQYGLRINSNKYQGKAGEYPFKLITSDGVVIYDVIYSIGEDGFRKDISSPSKDVFIYGGSFVYGEGLNDDETLSHYLYADHNISSKNVGFHGWGMHHALLNLKTGPASISGGVNVLLTSPWHALRSSCKQTWTANHPRFAIVDGELTQTGVCKKVKEESVLRNVLSKSNLYKFYKQLSTNIYLSNGDIELWLSLIEEIHAISKNRGAKLLVGYIDALEGEFAKTDWSNEKIINALSINTPKAALITYKGLLTTKLMFSNNPIETKKILLNTSLIGRKSATIW